jgi:hypothetical protein
MVIEWSPYHSVTFEAPKDKFESQEYSFQLARDMLAKKLVVRMRSKSLWTNVDLRFGEPSLLNPQCGYITPGNTEGDLFARIVKALRGRTSGTAMLYLASGSVMRHSSSPRTPRK